MPKMTVRDVEVAGKRVFLRVDFNVPIDETTGVIGDEIRIREALPTIKYLLEHKAKVIICSHLGRPKGKVDDKFRLAPVGKRLSELLKKPVTTTRDCIGPAVEKAVAAYNAGGSRIEEWATQAGAAETAEFVESIPITQTREFVYIVLRNYRFYRDLYAQP